MNYLDTTKELIDLNEYLQKIKNNYIVLYDLDIKCEKILNKWYKIENKIEYKRQIILTTSNYIEDQFIINNIIDKDNELEFMDISNIKNKIIGYITFYTNDYEDELVDESISMINFNDYNGQLEYFEDLINNIEWTNK